MIVLKFKNTFKTKNKSYLKLTWHPLEFDPKLTKQLNKQLSTSSLCLS